MHLAVNSRGRRPDPWADWLEQVRRDYAAMLVRQRRAEQRFIAANDPRMFHAPILEAAQ